MTDERGGMGTGAGNPARRRWLVGTAAAWAGLAAAGVGMAGLPGGARAASASSPAPMVALDLVYIPALFLTGSAGKGADGPARAAAALARLQQQWPALRSRMQAVWPGDAGWRRALAAVEADIGEAARHASQQAWPASHEALESVRLRLKAAREARGMDYALDRYTAFHETMEALAGVGSERPAAALSPARRGEIERLYARARAEWHAIERVPVDATALGLSAPRERRLRQALQEEGEALSALSRALHAGDERAIRQAAQGLKPPFVRAYTAFGLGEGERPPPLT